MNKNRMKIKHIVYVGVIASFVLGVFFSYYAYSNTLLFPIDYTDKFSKIYTDKKPSDDFIETYLDLNHGITFNYYKYPHMSVNVGSYDPNLSGILLHFYIESTLVELYAYENEGSDLLTEAQKIKPHEWSELLDIRYSSEHIGKNEVVVAHTVIDEGFESTIVPSKGGQINPFEKEIGKEIKMYFFKNKDRLYFFRISGYYLDNNKDYLQIIETFEFL